MGSGMDVGTFEVEDRVEQDHWWFVGRRNLFAVILRQLAIARDARVLDLGTSTGTNLRLLKDLGYSNYLGVDYSQDALAYCRSKDLGTVLRGDVRALPFPDNSYDFVLATDIIEHIQEDNIAVAEIRRVLRPRGRVLITVPAFQSLWGLQDDQAFHVRRYRKRPLLELVRESGLEVRDCYYFNYLLFVPIWAARQVVRMLGIKLASENEINTPLMNAILKGIFSLDIRSAAHIRAPFGVSILLLAQKPA